MEFADLILIPTLDGVTLKIPHHEDVVGTLCITGHHLILSSRKEGVQELVLLHQNIDVIERRENKPLPNGNPQGGSMVLKCKDLRILQLDVACRTSLAKAARSLENLCSIADPRLLYPFFYKPMYSILEDGYNIFRPETEYAKLLSTDEWRLSWVNRGYAVCPSYPQALLVPRHADDETLAASAAFRKGGRFPLLSYRHENGAVLMRSSQPLVGPQNKRCKPDERLLNMMIGPDKGFIFDLRSPSLVAQQKAKGGGMESNSHYPQWQKVNRAMDKVSNLQLLESFTKLMEVCNDKSISCDKWLGKLDSCGWMGHVLDALDTACTVAQCLEQEACPVLVHGSKGLDATLVVCSLVQVIMNPDCRTVRGIQALIEREWIQAGHPFTARHSRSCYVSSSGPRKASLSSALASPSFLLLLDCLHQLLEQFPCSFEFTQDLLVSLFEHSYFSQYGSFLGNCEKDREEMGVFQQTTSLWSHTNTPDAVEAVISPLYEPNQGIIWPSVAPMSLVLWEELYLRWIIDFTEQREALDQICKLRQKDKELRSKTNRLRKQLRDLVKEVRELEGRDDIQLTHELLSVTSQEELQNSTLDLEVEEKE